jgi:hypothetical protein
MSAFVGAFDPRPLTVVGPALDSGWTLGTGRASGFVFGLMVNKGLGTTGYSLRHRRHSCCPVEN